MEVNIHVADGILQQGFQAHAFDLGWIEGVEGHRLTDTHNAAYAAHGEGIEAEDLLLALVEHFPQAGEAFVEAGHLGGWVARQGGIFRKNEEEMPLFEMGKAFLKDPMQAFWLMIGGNAAEGAEQGDGEAREQTGEVHAERRWNMKLALGEILIEIGGGFLFIYHIGDDPGIDAHRQGSDDGDRAEGI